MERLIDREMELSQDIHTHSSDCIEYEPVEEHYNPGNPYATHTHYIAWCNLLDKQVPNYTENRFEVEDYEDED